MVQTRVSRKSADIVLKYTAEALGGALFARFGLSLPPIVAGLPSELPQLRISSQQTDLLFRLADGSILHLEFQTTRRAGDLLRFAAYNLAVSQHYGQPVWTVVLYGAGIRSARDTLQAGSLTFHVHNILVGKEDGDAVLRRLREKAARDESFTSTDRIDLILAPLMRQKRVAAEVAREAAHLTVHLPREQREMTVGALIGLSYPTVSKDVVAAILEELGMTTMLEALAEEIEARLTPQVEARLTLQIEARLGPQIEARLEPQIEARVEARLVPEIEVRSERKALRTFLKTRFGAIPRAVQRRIDAADSTQLDALLERAATITRIDEL